MQSKNVVVIFMSKVVKISHCCDAIPVSSFLFGHKSQRTLFYCCCSVFVVRVFNVSSFFSFVENFVYFWLKTTTPYLQFSAGGKQKQNSADLSPWHHKPH